MRKRKLHYHQQLDWVGSMTKTTQENDMTDLTHATYAKTKTELS